METNQLLINYYKKEEIKKAKSRKQEGLTTEEIIRLANKEYINVEEIKQALGIEDDEPIGNEPIEEHIVDKEDIVIEDEIEKQQENVKIVMIAIDKLIDYPNQPFKLYDEDKKKEMIESIKINGIMQPLIVRPMENGKYQIIAGHNRRNCAKEIGLVELPCIIKENLTEDEVKIYLIDTNLCTRENISPIERAKAYRIKYDTYKKRNIKTSMVEEIKKDNSGLARATIIKEEKSSNGTIQRYLRLTYLIPELQEMIEQGKMSINIGEKVSFLPNEEQKSLAEILTEQKIKLTETLVKKIRKASENYKIEDYTNYLTKEEIIDLIENRNKIQINIIERVTITFTKEEVLRYFQHYKDEEEIKHYILETLEKI